MKRGKIPAVWGCNHGRTQFACQYYRIEVPLEGFSRNGYAACWNDTLENGFDASMAAMLNADFDLFWGLNGQVMYDQLRILNEMKPSKQADGSLRIPPILIFDLDDNRDYVHPHSEVFCEHGVRGYPDTKLLKALPEPQSLALHSLDEETGEKTTLWIDRVTSSRGKIFDIERNQRDMRIHHKMLRLCDGITCVSPHHAKYLREVIGIENVHVFPNTILPDHYRSYPLMPHEGIRILWQGGSSHIIDWYPLRHAVAEIARKYPNVTWVIFGQKDEWVSKYLPADRVEHHPWVAYSAYKMKRALLQIDINLCPLADNFFNRCKSAIKWYEASVWDKPEATLAANVPPFSDEMTDGENGLLYDDPTDFVQKLSLLVEDAELRQRLAHSARQWVLTNRGPHATIPALWDFYQECQQRRIGSALLQAGASNLEIKRLAAQQGLLR